MYLPLAIGPVSKVLFPVRWLAGSAYKGLGVSQAAYRDSSALEKRQVPLLAHTTRFGFQALAPLFLGPKRAFFTRPPPDKWDAMR